MFSIKADIFFKKVLVTAFLRCFYYNLSVFMHGTEMNCYRLHVVVLLDLLYPVNYLKTIAY